MFLVLQVFFMSVISVISVMSVIGVVNVYILGILMSGVLIAWWLVIVLRMILVL